MSPRLRVGEHQQVFLVGVGDHFRQGRHAVGTEGLGAGQLRLHDRHGQGATTSITLPAKRSKMRRQLPRRGGCCRAERRRGSDIAARVEADAGAGSGGL